MSMVAKFLDKFLSSGIVIFALGCASCFPALGTLATSLGLGFLSTFEGVFINKLMPLFAVLLTIINLYSWSIHRKFLRGIVSLVGPCLVWLTLYPLWSYNWSTGLLYSGLIIMIIFSIYDILRPAKAACRVEN